MTTTATWAHYSIASLGGSMWSLSIGTYQPGHVNEVRIVVRGTTVQPRFEILYTDGYKVQMGGRFDSFWDAERQAIAILTGEHTPAFGSDWNTIKHPELEVIRPMTFGPRRLLETALRDMRIDRELELLDAAS